MDRKLKLYDLTLGLFIAVLLISNIASTKIIDIGPFTFDGGTILFPIIYIFDDVLTEVYGFGGSRRIIWSGFFALILMSAVFWIVGMIPPAHGWELQSAYQSILMATPRIALASMVAYFAGEFTNSFILSKMKVWTEGKHLWSRTIGSTIFGEFIDTIIFCTIAFMGVLPNALLVTVMISNYVFKVLYEVVATPITYAVIGAYKKVEGIDTFDTEYKVFKLEV